MVQLLARPPVLLLLLLLLWSRGRRSVQPDIELISARLFGGRNSSSTEGSQNDVFISPRRQHCIGSARRRLMLEADYRGLSV